jgi:large subunit ribosomal protein L4e
MKVNVYSIDSKKKREIELPSVFLEDIRTDIIKRAVLAVQSERYQPQGVDPLAGKRTSATSWGPGHGVSRVPRVKGSRHHAAGRAAFVPQAVGGRVAHPPVVEKKIVKKINLKEKRKALRSAIAATKERELVEARGHKIEKLPEIPLIVEDKIQSLKTAKETREVFITLGVWEDILRAKERKIRAGKGKMRGRKYKTKKSALLVISEDKGIKNGARNHPGVDVVTVNELSVEHLAPGATPGRLTIYTESALKKIEERFK